MFRRWTLCTAEARASCDGLGEAELDAPAAVARAAIEVHFLGLVLDDGVQLAGTAPRASWQWVAEQVVGLAIGDPVDGRPRIDDGHYGLPSVSAK
jgi:hypothetical protein